MIRECNKWNVYFFDNLSKLVFIQIFFLDFFSSLFFLQKQVWINKNGPNRLTTGELWIAFLRYYTEQFDYEQNVITIRQFEPLRRDEKGWFHPTIAIEDPFIITHNLADKLSVQSTKSLKISLSLKLYIFN
jgi:DNA polymerase sigma